MLKFDTRHRWKSSHLTCLFFLKKAKKKAKAYFLKCQTIPLSHVCCHACCHNTQVKTFSLGATAPTVRTIWHFKPHSYSSIQLLAQSLRYHHSLLCWAWCFVGGEWRQTSTQYILHSHDDLFQVSWLTHMY